MAGKSFDPNQKIKRQHHAIMALPLLLCTMKKQLLLLVAILALFSACQPDNKPTSYRTVEGKTMGTYYKVTYQDSLDRDFFTAIDSMLVQINHEISKIGRAHV